MMGVAGKWAARKWTTPDVVDDDWAHDEKVAYSALPPGCAQRRRTGAHGCGTA